jgi:nitrite reductase/ring-hydroxylating ferredoxin subunit
MTGRTASGRALTLGGLAAATAGGFLGRHLAFPMGAGASHAEPVTHLAPLGWHNLCKVSDLPQGRPVSRRLGYLTLVVVRHRGEICVLDDQCAHLGGPLHQGELVTSADGSPCLVCPWHGSTFRLADGSVMRGPATARQPAFEVRVTAERTVQVRPRNAGHD